MNWFHILTITCVILSVVLGIVLWNVTKDLCKDIQIAEFKNGCNQGNQFAYTMWIIGSIVIWAFVSWINKIQDENSRLPITSGGKGNQT